MSNQQTINPPCVSSDLAGWGIVDLATLAANGAKLSGGGAHITRTMMLAELTRLVDILTADADEDAYRDAVITRNVLGKVTESTRSRTYRHLRELYGLSLSVPLFAILRQLHQVDPQSLPQLAVLVAWARDPQLRATSDAILRSRPDQPVAVDALEEAAMPILSGQYNRKSIHNIAKNAHSSWTKAGLLVGRTNKTRAKPQVRPMAVTLALLLAEISGLHGDAGFSSIWCRLLDLTSEQARSLAMQAHREGLLDMRVIGAVVDITFPRFRPLLKEAA